MKKVPIWIQKVIVFSQKYPCADTRETLMNQLHSGSFDYDAFVELCKNSHIAFDEKGDQIWTGGNGHGAFENQWEAIKEAGKTGTVKSMQGVLHEIFNNQ